MVEIGEVHGGTRGTDYLFIIKGEEILHLSQIRGVQCIFRENKKRKRLVIWDVPEKEIANCRAIWASYSNSGHLFLRLLKIPGENTLKKYKRLDLLSYVSADDTEEILDSIKRQDLKFREFSREHNMVTNYFRYVPKLVEDFWDTMKSLGISSVYMGGGGHRLEEVLQNPKLGYVTSMLLPTEQGRTLSLYKKLSGMFELWILSKIAKALHQLGRITDKKDWIFVESTKNNKIIEFDIDGKRYAIFYQPSIIPHVISGFLPEDRLQDLKKRLGVKKLHLIPDIVIAEDVDEYLEWGDFHKTRGKVKLIVEAKLTLKGITQYDTIELTESQLEAYTKLLNASALVVILEPNRYAKFKLEESAKAKVVDDAVNNANQIVDAVKEVIGSTL